MRRQDLEINLSIGKGGTHLLACVRLRHAGDRMPRRGVREQRIAPLQHEPRVQQLQAQFEPFALTPGPLQAGGNASAKRVARRHELVLAALYARADGEAQSLRLPFDAQVLLGRAR